MIAERPPAFGDRTRYVRIPAGGIVPSAESGFLHRSKSERSSAHHPEKRSFAEAADLR